MAAAQDLPTTLARSDVYPQMRGRVEVRETHISWVFLVGDRAYKLKKPLVLPFVNYGSPARRLEMCREEVRLNRRLAPDVYLGVVGVAPTDAGVEFTSADDPHAIDYLVEMRRYDERDTPAVVLERGDLERSQIEEVGRTLARFHAGCRRADDQVRGSHRIKRRVAGNAQELLELAEQPAERRQIRTMIRFIAAFRRRFDRAAFRKSFGDAAPTLFLECQAPAAELAARADRRAQDSTRVSDADLEIVMRERSSWEPLDEIPASEQFVLRTDRPLDDIIQELYALLDRRL